MVELEPFGCDSGRGWLPVDRLKEVPGSARSGQSQAFGPRSDLSRSLPRGSSGQVPAKFPPVQKVWPVQMFRTVLKFRPEFSDEVSDCPESFGQVSDCPDVSRFRVTGGSRFVAFPDRGYLASAVSGTNRAFGPEVLAGVLACPSSGRLLACPGSSRFLACPEFWEIPGQFLDVLGQSGSYLDSPVLG